MKKDDLQAQDIFGRNPVEEKKKEYEVAQEVEEEKSVPPHYVPVKLSSLGKLHLPSVVHVRDYTYNEVLKLVEMQDTEKVTESLIGILNDVVFEDIDMGKAHKQDVLEILLTIYGTWYSSVLETFRYYVDLEKEGEEREKPENISVATIPINNIKTEPVDEHVSIPINIEKQGLKVQLLPPKIENDVVAWKYAVKKNIAWENKVQDAIKAVKNEDYTQDQLHAYSEFMNERGKDFMRALQAQSIYSYQEKTLKKLSEKLEALNEISVGVWTTYNKILKEKFNFGLQPEVQFQCSITGNTITRRFQFRPIHFLSVLEQDSDTGFNISFG